MNDQITFIMDALSNANQGPLAHAIIGLLILFVGLVIVNFIISILRSLLNKASFLKREMPDGSEVDMASPIASLSKAVLTVFVLIAVLEHFKLTDVLAPLKDMMNEFMRAIPNIIGAIVVGYAGWTIAKIVSQITTIALGKVDGVIAEQTGRSDIKVSKFGGAFVFAGIVLPVIVAALGVLNIPAISIPASAMIKELMAAVPNVIGAFIILLVAYYTAKFVAYVLGGLLEGMQFNALPEKLGIKGVFTTSFTPTKLVGGSVIFFSMLAASTAAVDLLGIEIVSVIFGKILEFGGGVLLGGVILIIGNFLSVLAHEKLSKAGSGNIAGIAKFAILGLVLAMGLKAMGLADNIVTMAFGFTFGSVAIAAALAFGLGGRDAAKKVADKWATQIAKK